MSTSHGGANEIRTRYPFSFVTLEGTELPVELTHLAWENGTGDVLPRCVMTFEAEGSIAAAMLAEERFHLIAGLLNAQPVFEPDAPVVIRARLRQSYTDRIAAAGGDSETVLAALLPDATEHTVLRQSESWLALDMMQQIDLPGPLQQEGKVRHGLQTAWNQVGAKPGAADPNKPTPEVSISRGDQSAPDATGNRSDGQPPVGTGTDGAVDGSQPTARLEGLLQQLGLRWEAFSPSILQLDLTTGAGSWRMLIHASKSGDWCSVYSVFPELVPTSVHGAVAVQLMNINYNGTGGAFELDAEDGELRYRTSVPGAASLSAETLADVLEEHQRIMDTYLPTSGDWSRFV